MEILAELHLEAAALHAVVVEVGEAERPGVNLSYNVRLGDRVETSMGNGFR